MTRSLVLLLAVMVPAASNAQSARRQAGDTLRFHESAVSSIDLQSPAGPQQRKSVTDSWLTLAFLGGDSAVVVYDSMRMDIGAPMPPEPIRAMTERVKGRRFAVRFKPDGVVEGGDSLIAELQLSVGMQLPQSRWSFALPFSAQRLRPGATWKDTVDTKLETPTGKLYYSPGLGIVVRHTMEAAGKSVVRMTGAMDMTMDGVQTMSSRLVLQPRK